MTADPRPGDVEVLGLSRPTGGRVVTDARTPIVRVELQLRPSPPDDASPYWWGNHMLSFHKNGEKVWEAAILPDVNHESWSLRVERCKGYGWVVVLTTTHDPARAILKASGLPEWVGCKNPPRILP